MILSSTLWDIREAFDNDPIFSEVDKYDADWIAAKVLSFAPLGFLNARDFYEEVYVLTNGEENLDKISQVFINHGIDYLKMPDVFYGINWITTSLDTGIRSLTKEKVQLSLPFPFTFYGVTYNEGDPIYIYRKGYVSFDSTNPYTLGWYPSSISWRTECTYCSIRKSFLVFVHS